MRVYGENEEEIVLDVWKFIEEFGVVKLQDDKG